MNTINTILLLQPAGSPQKSSPPLGLGYVATYLKHKLPQIRIKIIDLLVENVDLAEELNSYRPDLIGVTGTTPAAKFMRHLFDRIRSLNPNIPIVVGGPHASAMKTGVFYMSVDFAVIGEGEETFVDLVNALNSRKNLAEVDGLIYRDANGSIIENKKRAYISDIDTIPMVDRSLFKMEKYASKGTLISTRGCPYNCIFCSQSFGRGWRAHSPEYVFNEIKEMVTRYGARTIRLMDDNPLIKKSRFQDICNLVINSNFFKKVRFELNHGTRMDIVDKEIFLLLKKIGIKKMWFGLESINADVRKGMRKQLSLDNIERAIEIAQSLGMMVNAFITIGMPGDNYEKSMETMRYVKKKKIDLVSLAVAMPMPGTDLYDWVEQNGRWINKDFETWEVARSIIFDTIDFPADERIHTLNEWLDFVKYRRYRVVCKYPVETIKFVIENSDILKNPFHQLFNRSKDR